MSTSSSKIFEPLYSLQRKSQKALEKITPNTWQYQRLTKIIEALEYGITIIRKSNNTRINSRHREHMNTLEAIQKSTENMIKKFPKESAQHTLLVNRRNAVQEVVTQLQSQLLK